MTIPSQSYISHCSIFTPKLFIIYCIIAVFKIIWRCKNYIISDVTYLICLTHNIELSFEAKLKNQVRNIFNFHYRVMHHNNCVYENLQYANHTYVYLGSNCKLWQLHINLQCNGLSQIQRFKCLLQAENSMTCTGRAYMVEVLIQVSLNPLTNE